MKILQKISILFICLFSFLSLSSSVHADIFEVWQQQSSTENNLNTQWAGETSWDSAKNDKIDGFGIDGWITVSQWGDEAIANTLIRIAKDLKNILFIIASLYLLILILKLLVSEKTEEEVSNFKKWGLWITIGLIVTQIAYLFVNTFFDRWVSENLAEEVSEKLIQPFISFLETGASFFFIAIAVYAFYKLVTAGWNEDTAKEWKMSIIYAIIWFIWVKLTKTIVYTIYGKIDCWSNVSEIIDINQPGDRADCLEPQNLEWFAQTIAQVINWTNGFIGIVVVLLVIFAGARVLLSGWDEESLTKAKSILLYIFIGIWVLVCNYLILTFFLIPESPIG